MLRNRHVAIIRVQMRRQALGANIAHLLDQIVAKDESDFEIIAFGSDLYFIRTPSTSI
tara:strand:+ start:3408 stop:3581 length:174 start_codon:yes stop_codon:yes gene_type:complete